MRQQWIIYFHTSPECSDNPLNMFSKIGWTKMSSPRVLKVCMRFYITNINFRISQNVIFGQTKGGIFKGCTRVLKLWVWFSTGLGRCWRLFCRHVRRIFFAFIMGAERSVEVLSGSSSRNKHLVCLWSLIQ